MLFTKRVGLLLPSFPTLHFSSSCPNSNYTAKQNLRQQHNGNNSSFPGVFLCFLGSIYQIVRSQQPEVNSPHSDLTDRNEAAKKSEDIIYTALSELR